MKKVLHYVLITCILSLSLVGCNNSYENMIAEFDSKYFSPEPIVYEPYSVNSSNFNPKEMLESCYVFSEGIYINLEAPENCQSYLWTCTNSEVNREEIGQERKLYYEVPGVFKIGEDNTLILTVTVTDAQGNITEYIDESVIIIKAQKNLDLEE